MNPGLTFDQMFPYMAAVGDYLGGLKPVCFDDGAWQFRTQDKKSSAVYSPRLKPFDLEKFCQNNLDQYTKFYDENWDAVKIPKSLPAIKIFWINETEKDFH